MMTAKTGKGDKMFDPVIRSGAFHDREVVWRPFDRPTPPFRNPLPIEGNAKSFTPDRKGDRAERQHIRHTFRS